MLKKVVVGCVLKWAILEKRNKQVGGGIEDMELPGILKKQNVEIPVRVN